VKQGIHADGVGDEAEMGQARTSWLTYPNGKKRCKINDISGFEILCCIARRSWDSSIAVVGCKLSIRIWLGH
jgi:hypothetical protein